MRVVVTGASGFLGSHLTQVLQREHEVVGAVRTPSKGAWLGVEMRTADLTDVDTLATAFEGCDVLVANAALAPGRANPSPQQFIDANVRGAHNQLEAARRAGIRRVVWISTVAVYSTSIRRVMSERHVLLDPDRPGFDWNNLTTNAGYSRSKAKAEQIAWAFCAEHGIDMTALRPGPIYGPRDPKLTARLVEATRKRFVVAPTVRVPYVFGADVGHAVAGAIRNTESAGKSYNTTGESVSMLRVHRAFRDAAGSSTRMIPLPLPLSIRFDDRAAQRDLGFSPRSIEDGARAVINHIREVR